MPSVFIISAPSGSGKSTLVNRLLEDVGSLQFSVSHTTRKPRGQEKDGESYYYVNRAEFESRISAGEFLEWAQVFGNYYGTHKTELDRARDAGCDLVLDIDVQGARQLKSKIQDAVSIFILAPSREILEQRLRARGEDSEEDVRRRLHEAAEEIRKYQLYDYVLVNREVEESAKTLSSIVRAERARRKNVEEEIRLILRSFEAGLNRGSLESGSGA
jgi:guanylate kinase